MYLSIVMVKEQIIRAKFGALDSIAFNKFEGSNAPAIEKINKHGFDL